MLAISPLLLRAPQVYLFFGLVQGLFSVIASCCWCFCLKIALLCVLASSLRLGCALEELVGLMASGVVLNGLNLLCAADFGE